MSLAKIFISLASSIFMFFAGNMQNWLIPWLEFNGIPIWITKSPAPIAFLFVFATVINMWFVGELSPKETNKITDTERKRIIKREEGKHKKSISSLKTEHSKEVEAKCKARQEQNNSLQANVKRPTTHPQDTESNNQPQFTDLFSTLKDSK